MRDVAYRLDAAQALPRFDRQSTHSSLHQDLLETTEGYSVRSYLRTLEDLHIDASSNDLLDGCTTIGDVRGAVPEQCQELDNAEDQAQQEAFELSVDDSGVQKKS